MRILKNIAQTGILFALMGLLVVSCSDQKKLENKLEGNWSAESVDGSGDDSNKKGTTKVEISASQAGEYIFNDDHTGSFDLTVHVKVTQSNGNVSLDKKVTTSGDFDWENGDNTITLSYTNNSNQGKKVTLDITNETENKIEVKGSDNLDLFLNNSVSVNNQVLDLDVNFTMTLKKQ